MELKDVILSTLAEMEDDTQKVQPQEATQQHVMQPQEQKSNPYEEQSSELDDEMLYLQSIRERLLVLFEGFQAPNNTNIEAKVDMTLNFLEYTLATIDARLEKLEKGTH